MRHKSVRLAAAITAALLAAEGSAAELPVPCAPGACGPTGPANWLTSGVARFVQSGPQLTVTQDSSNATLNWSSFNVGADGRVVFQQPDSNAVALNRIFQADPSRIFGRLEANGRVWLLNRNGIVFGSGSQVNVGGLLASTLDITTDALELGIARAASRGSPAFDVYRDGGAELASAPIRVEHGARIDTSAGGQVLLFAPDVSNGGRVSAPDGQILVGAGKRVFLLASSDPGIRGLLVEVGDGGTATNDAGTAGAPGTAPVGVGELIAERGNVTIAALAVNQSGRVSATTSTRQNGSIRLTARDTASRTLPNVGQLVAERTGALTLGAGSQTAVALDATDTTSSVDVNVQPKSRVELFGRTVQVGADALIRATSGIVDIVARTDTAVGVDDFSPIPDASRIVVERGARIDVAGASTSLPMERNSLRVELRGSQLADFPLQRDGALRGETVYVDVRQSGTRSDGTAWQGSPIGDLTGNVTTIERDVLERNLGGGSISMVSQGAVTIASGATVDVSGGQIQWQDGFVLTSRVLGIDGRTYEIAAASPDRAYVGIVGERTLVDTRWGLQATYSLGDPRGTFQAGYVEGKDAGSITLTAPRVAVDGTLRGAATVGPNQRQPRAAGFTGLYRPWTQVPAAGQLVVGFNQPIVGTIPTNYLTSGIVLAAGRTLDSYRNADGSAFDPLLDPIPDDFDRTWLRPEIWSGSFGEITLYANGSVVVPEATDARLAVGGRFTVNAGRIDVAGDIEIVGGSVSLAARRTPTYAAETPEVAPGLSLAPTGRIDVSGRWTNDAPPSGPGTAPRSPIALAGGNVTLVAEDGPLLLSSGAVVDVSGGARRAPDGRITAGNGGAIAISSGVRGIAAAPELQLDAELRGYGLTRGGSLAVSTGRACIGVAACADPAARRFDPAFFATGGFAAYSLNANLGDLRVHGDAVIEPRQSNFVLRETARTTPSGAPLGALSTVAVLPAEARTPTSVALSAGVNTRLFENFGDLLVDAGAIIRTDPRASVTLTSNSRVVYAGTIDAPAGSVLLRLDSTSPVRQFRPDQGIWLAPGGSIDVSGTPLVQVSNVAGRLTGQVLAGGNVTLDASRGYVIALQGSRIDLSGSAADLDVRQAGGIFARESVASAAGALTIHAAEGLVLASTLAARGGGASAPNGRLDVTISSRRNGDDAGTFPLTTRRIVVTGDGAPLALVPGAAVPSALNGQALIQTPFVNAGGFDDISLRALSTLVPRQLEEVLPRVVSSGEIVFQPDTVLAADGRVVLDAALIGLGGAGSARVSAAYVSVGPADPLGQEAAEVAAGAGRLDVRGEVVDVRGELGLDGIETFRVAATEAMRLVGTFPSSGTEYRVRVRTPGSIEIDAPTTLVATLTNAELDAGGAVRWMPNPNGPRAPALSAGGSLAVRAASIQIDGRVETPLGSMLLVAPRVSVGATGQLVSTLGATVPFGRIEAGRDWVFELEEGLKRTYPDGLPARAVVIDASAIDVSAGAVIDVSGVGDVLGSEFQPGPTGTVNVLAASSNSGLFAIFPGRDERFAAVDPNEYRGSALRPGDSVYLAGSDGVPAGVYALYPASYALLPGARLVSAAGGFQGIVPGERLPQADGTTVIAGYRTIVGTDSRPAEYTAFRIRDAADVGSLGRYDRVSGNAFFDDAAAARRGVERLAAPRDAGALVLNAGATLRFDGAFRAAVGAGGRAADVDVAATRLRVVGTSSAPAPGVVEIEARQLANLSGGSVLIGGRRKIVDGAVEIAATASEVVVVGGVDLAATELILAARDLVRVEGGATVRSTGTGGATAEALAVAGSSALLRTSTGAQPEFARVDGEPGSGRVELDAGAQIISSGSTLVAATGPSLFGGSFVASGGGFALDVGTLTFSDAGVGSADVVSATQLAASGARAIEVRAAAGIRVDGAVRLSAEQVSLSAASIASGPGGGDLRVTGERFELTGTSSGVTPIAGVGRFTVESAQQTIAGGNVALGFSEVALRPTQLLRIAGGGAVVASGDVAIDRGLLAAAPGVDFSLNAAGSIGIAGGHSGGIDASELGTSLTLRGRSVSVDGVVSAAAGRIAIGATESVRVGSAAFLYVGAPRLVVDDVVLPVPGGDISLVADAGNVVVSTGARLDAAALGRAAGGSISAVSVAGDVAFDGSAALGGPNGGGRLAIDGGRVDLTSVAMVASAANAGSLAVRRRDSGSLVLASGTVLRASQVQLIADQGGIELRGDVDARGPNGGSLGLYARDRVSVAGVVQLQSNSPGEFTTARLDVNSSSGFALEAGGRLDFGAAGDRRLWVRLPRDGVLTLANGSTGDDAVRLAGTIGGSPDFVLEGNATYQLPAGTIGAANVNASPANPWFADATSFMSAAATVDVPGLQPRVVPGLELTSAGTLTLAADWNVAAWRFAGAAPVISLRAGGDVVLNRSLSDGFAAVSGATAFTLPTVPELSASYRIVAGADFTSPAALATLPQNRSQARVVLAGGTPRTTSTPGSYRMIRTGTGSIAIAAAGDLVLTNQASTIYTAGVRSGGVLIPGSTLTGGLGNRPYPDGGGDIEINVGGDVVGARSNQLVTEWLWRTGGRESEPRPRATAWTVAYDYFEQGIGALGGGNVTVSAGGSIRDLGASVPSIGRQVGGTSVAANRVEQIGGGRLTVNAGADVLGGTFYVGRGSGELRAGGQVAAPRPNDQLSFAPLLAVGDARIDVVARRDAIVETVFDPMLITPSQLIGPVARAYFATYTGESASSLTSIGGGLRLGAATGDDGPLGTFYARTIGVQNDIGARIAPPTVEAYAASGMAQIGGSLTLWPSQRGNLTVIADDDVLLQPITSTGFYTVILSDADATNFLPTVNGPVVGLANFQALANPYLGDPAFYAPTPVHAATPTVGADPEPMRLVSARGDVSFLPGTVSNLSIVFSAKRFRVVAGGDVLSLGIRGQNVAPGDVSSVIAGGSVTYPLIRDARGAISESLREISLGGPGALEVVAGGDVNLETSRGITSEGGLRNIALSSQPGSSVSVTAGLGDAQPALDAFQRQYLVESSDYAELLAEYVELVTGVPPTSEADALARFDALSTAQRKALLERILFAELRAGGRAAAQAGPGNNDFTRAFTALETYFPGANPDVDGGEVNPYAGDIRLVFSRIYTLSGGDVRLLAPGGEVNVGLATAPASFGIAKAASQLGIVVQSVGNVESLSNSDFQVNESRVFAGDGGDILVWSTRGDIDAGRGAKTAISAPPPVITIDDQGQPRIEFPAAFVGSGIQTLATTPGNEPGDVDLFAPRGVVNAGDAGIVAGNLTIAATAVLGANNISVSGTSVGVPVDTGGLGASLAGASASAGAASGTATSDLAGGSEGAASEAPLSDSAIQFLEVFVTGLGDEGCRPDDLECLKRQPKN